MMAVPLLPDTIDAVAERVAAGHDNATIRAALGLGRNSLAGIINRLRQRGDPRVPAAGGPLIRSSASQRDAIADAFAEGASDLPAAARSAGLPYPIAKRRWDEICIKLGRQAQ